MIRFKKYLLFFLIFFLGFFSTAQFYDAGQAPFSIKWKQINTDNFQIIFPEGYEENASYVADVLEHAYIYGSKTLEHKPSKVSVIIHNQTVVSNGFVAWAPRRIEMYTNPPQTNDVHDWLERLAVHEFRHVVQIDKLNQGLTRLLYFLFGEQAIGAVLGLYVPMWLLEGDAVALETAITHGGRGRMPGFEKGLRAQIIEKERYSFDKAVFGSYKDYVPNHYEFGYQMVATTRKKYGKNAWAGVIENVARRPYSIIPFSRGIKHNTGHNKIQLYHSNFDYLTEHWQKQHSKINPSEKIIVSQLQKHYTNYNQVQFVDKNTLIALKTGLSDIPKIVRLRTDGTEETLFTPGWYLPKSFSYAEGKVVWAEYRYDLRWEHRNWSEIHVFDIQSKEKRRLTDKTRYFAPSISPDGKKVVAVETTEDYQSYLVVLDIDSGKEIHRVTPDNDEFIMTPAWNSSGEKIVMIVQNNQGKRIVEFDLSENSTYDLWSSGYINIADPVYYGENILFSGAFSGIDDIYMYDKTENEVFRIISSSFGAYEPDISPCGDFIGWSDYNSDGYRVAIAKMEGIEKIKIENVKDHSTKFHKILAEQEETIVSKDNIEQHNHDVKPYNRALNLFNPHSWGLAYVDAVNYNINPGASIMFQNLLSTSFANLGYVYDLNDNTGTWRAEYSYKGFYPVIDVHAQTADRVGHYKDTDSSLKSFLWKESMAGIGARTPLTFTRYSYYYRLQPSVNTSIGKIIIDEDAPDFIIDNSIHYMSYRLTASRYKRSVMKDIMPRWGQFIDINFRNAPFGGQDMGEVFSAQAVGYFPGLFNHHSIRLSASYQKRKEGEPVSNTINYAFPNIIRYPRGITGQFHNELQIYSFDYFMPLMYPDLSLPGVFYIKRIWCSPFFDYAEGKYLDNTDIFKVAGISLHSDVHLLRFFNPFTIGARVNYNIHEDSTSFDFLFNFRF